MSGVYSQKDVCRLFSVTRSRLRYWDKSGFLSPSGRNGRRRCYTFQDLIAIRSVMTLLDNGISLQRTRRILAKLRDALPRSSHPLGRLRILADAKTVIVTDVDRDIEADTGQMLLNFEVKSLENQVAELPNHEPESRHMSAYEWYLEGCRLDECEETLALAEKAYHRAIHMDPTLANAYTNLGNLLYRTGSAEDAKALYEKAIEVDGKQPEAHYNLGFLEFDAGRFVDAEACFSRAIELDATFADAHFNLAITCFRLGKTEHAEQRLRTYLSLEPEGPWADTARQRLDELSP
jgi:tetratricopeptide (TPR) repeat protein